MQIGDCSKIHVWKDPWLRDPDFPSLIGPTQVGFDMLKVSDHLLPIEKNRNTHFIQITMFPSHIQAILNVPLFDGVTMDLVFWWPNKDGTYSIKSAYNIFMERVVDLSHHHCKGEWDVIWKMKIPQNVKIFLWRACRNLLPLWCNL